MSDIKVKLTEQTIGVPDTGLFTILNTDGDNVITNHYGLIVGSCAAILIILVLVTITIITKKSSHRVYAKSNSRFSIHSKARTTLGLSAIMLLSASILIPLASQQFDNKQNLAQAATDGTLTISTNPVSITAELTEEDAITAVSSKVVITSATISGYTLSAYATEKDLIPTDDAITTKISGFASDNAEPATLPSNSWGLAVTEPADASSEVWYAMPTSESDAVTIRTVNKATTAEDVATVWYGINVNNKLEAGEYSGTINYVAVANIAPIPEPDPEPNPNPDQTPELDPTALYMQDIATWKGTHLADINDTVKAVDKRDGKTYWVAKLADGNIWMTQNLDLDLDSDRTYTPEDTDIKANWKPAASTMTEGNAGGNYYEPRSVDPGNLCWNGVFDTEGELDLEAVTSSCAQAGDHYHLGNYYNWTAAVAMNDSSSYISQTDVDQSICPAGWMLPKIGSEAGDKTYYNLLLEYGYNSESQKLGSDYNISGDPLYFAQSGFWDIAPSRIGDAGFFTTSVTQLYNVSYSLSFEGNGYIDIDGHGGRSTAISVRCVAR